MKYKGEQMTEKDVAKRIIKDALSLGFDAQGDIISTMTTKQQKNVTRHMEAMMARISKITADKKKAEAKPAKKKK